MNASVSTSSRNGKIGSTCSSSNSSASKSDNIIKKENSIPGKTESVFGGYSAPDDRGVLTIEDNDVRHRRVIKQALESEDERDEVLHP